MRAINLLGVYLGEERHLFSPTVDNPKGVWEREDVVHLHNDLLAHLNGEWQTCLHLDDSWHSSDDVKPFKDRLVSLILEKFSSRLLWGWKDPRTCVLLPLWINVLNEMEVALSAVYVVRNPLDVARSLHKRNNFSYDKSFGLWFFYNLMALLASRTVVQHFISYDRFLGNWKGELKKCADSLKIDWPKDESILKQRMGEFVRPDLRHSVSGRAELVREGVPSPVIRLFDLLEHAVNQQPIGNSLLIAAAEGLYADFRSYARFFDYDLLQLWERGKTIDHLHVQNNKLSAAVQPVEESVLETNGIVPAFSARTIGRDFLRRIQGYLDKLSRFHESHHDGADEPKYKIWLLNNEPGRKQLAVQKAEARLLSYRPKISIIAPIYNPDRYVLIQCIESVLAQTYDYWELCLADGGSIQDYVKRIIGDYASKDSRIRYVSLPQNKGIAGNSNEALQLASGDYIGLLDHDDTLSPFALYEVVKLLNDVPEIDVVYSDEDKISAANEKRYNPVFKPEWSPDTFLSYNYICHFAVLRRILVDQVGGFREGYDGAQDYDLFLRIAQRTDKIGHIPKVLYHWRASQGSAAGNQLAKPYALDAAKRAIGEHLKGWGLDAEVVDGKFPTSYRVTYKIKGNPKVSIIIPTRDKAHFLKRCVSSILEKTDYKEFEIVIMDNGSAEQETREYFTALQEDSRIRIISYNAPFNFASINNVAVRSVTTDFVLFLNNDTEVIAPEWLSAMLEFAQREDVGAVGAKLYYPNDTVQHGGVVIGLRGVADHAHREFPRSSDGYIGRLNVIQNVSAVTGACLMTRRKVFDEVGGFEERLSYCFNDVDLCLKIRQKGYLIIWTPYAELYHHESASGASKGYDATPEGRERNAEEAAFMREKWSDILSSGDPYYSPNLTLDRCDFDIRV